MKTNDVITLSNNSKYLILSIAEYNNLTYYYIVGVKDDFTDSTEDIKILKGEKESKNLTIVTDEAEVVKVLPLLKVE